MKKVCYRYYIIGNNLKPKRSHLPSIFLRIFSTLIKKGADFKTFVNPFYFFYHKDVEVAIF